MATLNDYKEWLQEVDIDPSDYESKDRTFKYIFIEWKLLEDNTGKQRLSIIEDIRTYLISSKRAD